MIVVDASVWASVYLAQDAHHIASRRWLRRWTSGGGGVVAPTLLVAAVAGAIARRIGQPRLAHQIVGDLLDDPTVSLVPLDADLAEAVARVAIDLRLRGADAVYVAVAQRFDLPLVTWDRAQQERASVLIEVGPPVDP